MRVLVFFSFGTSFFAVQMIQLNTKNNSKEVSSKRKGIQYVDLPNMCVKNTTKFFLSFKKTPRTNPMHKNVEQNLDPFQVYVSSAPSHPTYIWANSSEVF